jgi:hypothetical protein
MEVEVRCKAVHHAVATAADNWCVRFFVLVVAVVICGVQRGVEIVLEAHDEPVAWMDAQVRRLASVSVAIAVVHLAASIAEVCVRQFHFQYAVFTAQVCGLGDKASNGGARTNVLLNTLRRRRWWNQTEREKRGPKKPQDALLPKPLTWQATAYAE